MKISGQPVCNACYGIVDLPNGAINNMSMDEFCSYRAFRDENQLLKEKFQISQEIDFGIFDTKMVFDIPNRLMCLSKSLDKTIFEGENIKSFVIKEDSTPLFEGDAQGLRCYTSTVPDNVKALEPQIRQFAMHAQMQRNMERMIERYWG